MDGEHRRPGQLRAAGTTNEVYLSDAVRTPFGKYGGALAGVRPGDLAALVVRALVERSPRVARSLQRTGSRWGGAVICLGVGQGLAGVLENAAS